MEERLTGLAIGRVNLTFWFMTKLQTDIDLLPVVSQHYSCAMRREHPLVDKPFSLEDFIVCDHLLVEAGGGWQPGPGERLD